VASRRLPVVAALLALLAACLVDGVAAQASSVRGVTVSGSKLLLNGHPTVFHGVNAYNATTYWKVNSGCGSQITNLDTLFNSVPSGSLVRTWAYQALGFNKFTHQIDFTAIDRAVAAAQAHGDYLIFALSDQAGRCDDGHWHDEAWYDGGYTKTYNDNQLGFSLSMSYLGWVKAVVTRYGSNPTVAIYEPVNEPEGSNCATGYTGSGCYGHTTCPSGATGSLRSFFDTVGGTIKSIDRRAIVSSGTLGDNQCGVTGTGFSTINASPSVDVATYHDYGSPAVALPTTLSSRAAQAAALGKVFLVEESGINASADGTGCPTPADRSTQFLAKMSAAKTVGADAYLPWNWAATPATTCAMTISPGDPLLTALLSGAG
jgi:mannan endo-1,4-beta-mannosidase